MKKSRDFRQTYAGQYEFHRTYMKSNWT